MANTADFPAQAWSAATADPLPYGFAKQLDVMRRGAAGVDQEIAVLFRDLCAANDHAAATGGVDFLPGLAVLRVGKGAAAGANAARLGISAAADNLFHASLDRVGVACGGAEFGMGKDPVRRRVGVAIGHAHLFRCGGHRGAAAVKAVGADGDVLELAAIGPGIHPQAPTNRAGNADQEFQPGQTLARRIACHIGIGCAGAGGDDIAVMADRLHMFAKPDHHAGNAAVTDQKVGPRADRQHRYVGRAGGKERAKIGGVGRAEDHISRTTDTKPGMARHRNSFAIVAAHLGQSVQQ